MTKLAMKNQTGSDVGSVEVLDAWLEREKGTQAVHDTVVAYLAAQRSGSACTKTKGDVRGGGKKPYRQKGTGHARAGSNRSPLWRGGGVTFGPQPRDYDKKINKKVRQLALRRAFTERVDAGDVIVVDSLALGEGKTKAIAQVLKAVNAGSNALIIDAAIADAVKLATRNMPKVDVVDSANVNVYQMLLHRKVVVTSAGLTSLGERLS